MATENADDHLDLLGYLSALWRRKWLVLLLVLITGAVSLVVSLREATAYQSSSRVLVQPTALNPPGSIPLAQTISMPTEAEVVRSQPVAALAAEGMGSGISASEVSSHTTVTFLPDTQVLVISYTAGDAEQARAGAEAVAESYLEDRAAEALDQANEVIAEGSAQITRLRADAAQAAEAAAVAEDGSAKQLEAETRAQELATQATIWQSNLAAINTQSIDAGRVLVAAGLPSEPASPDHQQAVLRGLLLGLLVGVAAALTIDASHRRRRRLSK